MKQTIFTLFAFTMALALLPASAQVAPSATGSRASLSAGGLLTYTQPDFDPNNLIVNNGVTSSPSHLLGIGGFVDYRVSRWVQLEAEGRWQSWNQVQGNTTSENLYAVGLREPIHTFGHITPYGKAMFGLGSGNFLTGHAGMYSLGGGVDYRLTKRISARADFEYQHWRVTPSLTPYTASLGFSYRIF